jgi:hypothetical protein
VAKGVPADLLDDTDPQRGGADESSHDALAPIRMLAARSGTCKYQILWAFVSRVLTPQQKSVGQLRIQWDRFLGSFGFAWTENLKNYRSDDADFVGLEVNVSPFQGKELAHPQTCTERHQYKRSFPQG